MMLETDQTPSPSLPNKNKRESLLQGLGVGTCLIGLELETNMDSILWQYNEVTYAADCYDFGKVTGFLGEDNSDQNMENSKTNLY